MYRDPYNLTDETIDNWSYWLFEENIKLINVSNSEKTSTVSLSNPDLTGPLQ